MAKDEYLELKEKKLTEFLRRRHPDYSGKERGEITLYNSFFQKSQSYPATDENFARVLSAYNIPASSPEEIMCLYTDEYKAELDVLAHVAAYFAIASRRLIDDIPIVFEREFALKFGEYLSDNLTTDLKLLGEAGVVNCQIFVRDEPHIEVRRAYLVRVLGILDEAKERIDRFFKLDSHYS